MNDNLLFEHGNYYLPERFKPIPNGRNKKLCRVTPHQKKVMEVLFHQGHIAKCGSHYRVRTQACAPVHKLSESGFLRIKKYLKNRKGVFVISGRAIAKLRRDTWVKKRWNELQKK